MKMMFWNIRGFGKAVRRRQIRDFIMEESLDGVGLQETIREDFTQKDLPNIAGSIQFRWVWSAAKGHSGGILMGVREEVLGVEGQEIGDHFVSMVVRNRRTNFRWELVTAYGPAQHDTASEFISELSRKCICATLPIVFGGDFNLIRQASENNNSNINVGLMDKFNMFIDLRQLKEIRRNGPRYTWTNKQARPVMETLDRILVATEWEDKHPLCFAWSKTRVGSDHWPIFLDSGENSMNRQKYFFFEKQWLLEQDFLSVFEKM
jgi:exonuclease III